MTATSSNTPVNARVRNTAVQSNQVSSAPPIMGAMIGARPIPAVTMDMARWAALPSYTSVTTARATTGPAQAATPWIKRSGSNTSRLLACMQANPASA